LYLIAPVIVLFIAYVAYLVRRSQLSLKYSYLWILFSAMSVAPIFLSEAIDDTLEIMGFEIPSNGIIVVSIVFLSFVCLHLSIQLSSIERKFENLVTKIAVDGAKDYSDD